MQEMNTHGTHHMSVRMIQLEIRWTDFDEIWYGRYATEDYKKNHFP
jgi:hypothetical protein